MVKVNKKIPNNRLTSKIACSFFAVLFILQSAVPSFAGQAIRRSAENTKSYRRLVWSDEFNYEGRPDPKKWSYDVGCGGWGNKAAQCYTKNLKNARVENGKLIIEVRKNVNGRKNYTSSRLTTL